MRITEMNRIKVGQRFVTPDGCEYILAKVTEFTVCLVNLKIGNRWINPFMVEDSDSITQREWNRITNGNPEYFTLNTRANGK